MNALNTALQQTQSSEIQKSSQPKETLLTLPHQLKKQLPLSVRY